MNFQQTHPMASFKNLVERGPGVGIKFSVNLLIHRQGGQIMSYGEGHDLCCSFPKHSRWARPLLTKSNNGLGTLKHAISGILQHLGCISGLSFSWFKFVWIQWMDFNWFCGELSRFQKYFQRFADDISKNDFVTKETWEWWNSRESSTWKLMFDR